MSAAPKVSKRISADTDNKKSRNSIDSTSKHSVSTDQKKNRNSVDSTRTEIDNKKGRSSIDSTRTIDSRRGNGSKQEATTKSNSNAAVIKIPGAKVTENDDGPSKRGRPQPQSSQGKEVKSILKKDKSNRRIANSSNVKKDEKKKAPKKKKSFWEKTAASFGFHVGPVIVTDPNALEAIQALDLQPSHLRRLKAKFDKIDLDGSGAIDYDEFFEAVGETRSPFTDKLFALIGRLYIISSSFHIIIISFIIMSYHIDYHNKSLSYH